MARVMVFAAGECDSCRYFSNEEPTRQGFTDVGRCSHPDGPENAHTTRTSTPERVSAQTRHVSSMMTCDHWRAKAA